MLMGSTLNLSYSYQVVDADTSDGIGIIQVIF